jgi:hypothetical protein
MQQALFNVTDRQVINIKLKALVIVEIYYELQS